jgi:hypothetical protein
VQRQYQNAHPRKPALDVQDRFHAVHPRHRQIHEDDMRLQLADGAHGVSTVIGFADNFEFRVLRQQRLQSSPYQSVIFNNQNAQKL